MSSQWVRLIRKSQLLLIHWHVFPPFQSLSIEVETVCDCPCEYRGNPGFEADSEACSGGNGDNACGVCFCHENFSGDACECDDQALVGSDNESNGQEQFRVQSSCRLEKKPHKIDLPIPQSPAELT